MIPGALNPDDEIDPLTGLPRRAPATFETGGGGATRSLAPPASSPPNLVPTATPGFPLIPGQLPSKSVSTTGEQRSHVEISPTHRAAMDKEAALIPDLDAAAQQKEQGRRDQEDSDAATAETARREAVAQAAAQAEYVKRRQQEAERASQLIAQKNADYDRRVAEMEKASKPTTYWEDKGVAAELLADIIVSLSDRSHALAGKSGPSPIAQKVAMRMAEDKERKLAAFERTKEFVKLAKEDAAAAQAAKTAKLLEIAEEHGAIVAGITKQYAALAAKEKEPGIRAKAEQEIADMKTGVAKDKQTIIKSQAEQEAAADVRVTSPTTTVTRNYGDQAPAHDLPKPEQGVLRKDGQGYHEMPNMPASRMENINKQLQSAGQINEEIQRYKAAGKDLIAAKQSGDSTAQDKAQRNLDDAAERLGRIAAANKIIEGKDEAGRDISVKGIVKIPIPWTGETKRDDLLKQVYASGFVKNLEKDIRENALSALNTAGVPRAQAEPAVDDYAPAPPPSRAAAVTDLANAVKSGSGIETAAKRAALAGVPDNVIQSVIRERRTR